MEFLSTISIILAMISSMICGEGYQNTLVQDVNTSHYPAEILNIGDIREDDLLDDVITVYFTQSFPRYPSISHLTNTATDIVRVEVIDTRIAWINTAIPNPDDPEGLEESDFSLFDLNPLIKKSLMGYSIFTVYQIRVLEVFKGDLEIGEIIEFAETGGQLDNFNLVNTEQPIHLSVGDDVVLFLSYLRRENIPAFLLNNTQSVYYFTPEVEEARMRGNFGVELESNSLRNSLVLTLEDLARITEAAQDQ